MKRSFILLCLLTFLQAQLSAFADYQYGRYSFPDSPRKVIGVKYNGGDAASAMPLGGLGTGTVYLTSDGTFEGNALENTYRPSSKSMPGCFFAIRTEHGTRALQTKPVGKIEGVSKLSYLGHFPMVDIDYGKDLGIGVQLRAMSPFILGDSKTSGTPGAMFRFRLSNPSDTPVKTALSFTWSMPDALPGQLASGDVDGYLVWNIGQLQPGESKAIPAIYAVADSPDELNAALTAVRIKGLDAPVFSLPELKNAVPYIISDPVRVKNTVTDFALDSSGAFNHDDFRSHGCMAMNGRDTLSQHSYRLFYKTDAEHSAGVAADQAQGTRLQGIELTEPTALGVDGIARTTLQTSDRTMVVQIASSMLEGTMAVQWFNVTNLSDKPVDNLRLAVYSNPYLSANPNSDSGKLDDKLQAMVVKAADSSKTAALAGLEDPASGWMGTWGYTLNSMASGRTAGMVIVRPQAIIERNDQPGSKVRFVSSRSQSSSGWTVGVIEQKQQTTILTPDLGSFKVDSGQTVSGNTYGLGAQLLSDLKLSSPQDTGCTAVVSEVTVPAHGYRDVKFVLGWYYLDAKDSNGKFVGHQYANWFESSSEAAVYLGENFSKIQSQIGSWQENIYSSDQPVWLKDQLVNSLYAMARNSAWLKDGRFSLSESFIGCPITETIVCRFYGTIPLAYFFPDLEKNNMRQFVRLQRDDGAIPFCFSGGEGWDYPVYDVQKILDSTEFALMAWRDYYYWKDKAWAVEIFPSVRKALLFAQTLDTDDDGLINDELSRQYYDLWQFYGASAYTASIQLAALRAGEELAKVVGDNAFANECRAWFAKAQSRFEELLWTGSYYRLYNNPFTGKKSNTSLGNQLVGQWYAGLCGLGDILPKDHIDSALDHVAKTNGSATEYGLVNGITADDNVDMEAGPHSSSLTIGETYCYASTCIREGKKDLGLPFAQRLVENIALKQRRNWNTSWSMDPATGVCAWGDEYYSNMCIWDLYTALTEYNLLK